MKKLLFIFLFVPIFIFGQTCSLSIIDSSDISCFGYNDGFIELSGSGGTGNFYYSLQTYNSTFNIWTEFANSPASGTYSPTNVTFALLMADCYKIVMSDSLGCTDSSIICLNQPDEILVTSILSNTSSSLLNDGSIILDSIFGGVPSYSFSWIGPNGFSSSLQDITNLEVGNYSLNVTDSILCVNTFSFTISTLSTLGCTDTLANNFNPLADTDDGSCVYPLTYIPDDNFETYLEANGMGDGIALNDSVLTYKIDTTTVLNIDSLFISDITGIGAFISLIDLDCSYNQLVFLDLSSNINLNTLRCSYNQISSLNITQNTNLTLLNCEANQLASIDIAQNINLVSLFINYNQLTNIDVSQNIALIDFHCYNNQITSLDVGQNIALRTLHCEGNQLNNLDVSQNISLIILHCSSNQLTSLDLSQNTALSLLVCVNNQINNLDLSQNISLNEIQCSNNQLVSLDCRQNSNMYYLNCSNNQLSSLDLRNGSNNLLTNSYFIINNNPNLTCISVDDSIYSTNTWLNIDSQHFFSENCNSLALSIHILDSIDVDCFGDNSGSIHLNGSGGSGVYNYQLLVFDSLYMAWIPIAQTPISNTYTTYPVIFSNLYSGCYKVIITDNNSGSDTDYVCLSEEDDIIILENISFSSSSLSSDGSISLTSILGGVAPYSFLWSGPNGYSSNNQDIVNLETGYYTLLVTDDNMCSKTFLYYVDFFVYGCTDLTANNYSPLASADDGSCCYLNFYYDNVIICIGDSVELEYSGSGNIVDSYLWSTGETDSTLIVSPSTTTQYILEQTTNGFVCADSITVTVSCLSFTPTISVSLSNLNCTLSDLTISVTQDPNEVDMDTALFLSDGGSFTIPLMSVGDNIGTSSMTIGSSTVNANLLVSSIVSSNEVIVEAVNQSSGVILGTFTITNLVGGGVSIIAVSTGDGNNYTINGNSSTVTFINVFNNPISGFLNITSNITSELGDVDLQVFPFVLNCASFTPTVYVLLSNTNCDSIANITISVSQDPFESDMDIATFSSNGGYFLISSLSIGDNIGAASMVLTSNIFSADLIVSSIVSSSEMIVEAIDQLTGVVLGTFTITNLLGGGVQIIAVSPGDGNFFTYGNSSLLNFNNIFVNPPASILEFTSNITSELGDIDIQSFIFPIYCTSFSPLVNVSLSNLNCSITDLTISVTQDPNEIDMDTAFFTSDGGSFTISSMNLGDNIGSASMFLSLNTFNADLLVSSLVSSSVVIVEAIDQLTGVVLGTFTITNLVGGGVEVIVVSPDDGNSYTSGNSSVITFNNVFDSPNTGFLNFFSEIISELGDTDQQIFPFTLYCTTFSPTVGVALSNLNCSLTDLTISVSQDANEFDMDTAFFTSDGGSFTILTMNIGDNIGSASMVLSANTFNADLFVSSLVSSSVVIVEAVDQLTGVILGTFTITNLVGGGVEIIVVSPDDGNFVTDGNSSVITFNNVFDSPNTGFLNFTSEIISELGDIDTQLIPFILNCTSFTPDVIVSLSNLSCGALADITISVTQDPYEVDIDSAFFTSDGGSFIISSLNVGDNIGSASMVLSTSTFSADLFVSSIVSTSEIIVEAINQITGAILGTFTITNLVGGGVEIIAVSPGDGNAFTLGNSSVVTFNNVFLNSSSGLLTFTSTIISELSDQDVQTSSFAIGSLFSYFTIFRCDEYIWNGNTYNSSGNYVDTMTSIIGCDSIVTLTLTITYSSTSSDTIIVCDQYIWNGNTYDSSGVYIDTLVNNVGCDSVMSLYLTVNSNSSNNVYNICDSLLWNGVTYDSTGIYIDTLVNSLGCDSVITLDLTVDYSSLSVDSIFSCDSLLWNGIVYNTTGLYYDTLVNSVGCDSIASLFLTINYTSYVLDTITACDSLIWNGNTYFNSGDYIDTLLSAFGCDSTVALTLIINNTSSSSNVITACDSLLWNGVSYNSSGIYNTILTNVAGCDSFIQLYLTIIPSVYNTLNIHSCGSYLWNGIILDTSGIFYDTLLSSTGCDSIVTLDLIVTDIVEASFNVLNVSCFNDSSAQINVSMTGGSPPFIYQWSNGFITEDIFSLYGDSMYNCIITDSAGCILDTNIFISQPSLLVVNEIINNISCYGGNNGSISLDINGGVYPYTVNWGSIDTINLVSAYYNYLVTDSNGCTVSDSVEITEENPILININSTNIQCFGQATGSIEINVLPGSGVSPYSYEWIGPNLFSSLNDDIFNLFAGDYFLTITDANLCEFDTIITLVQPANLPQNTNIQTSNYSGFNIGCKGENSGWVSVVVTGGYEPYTYLWSNLETSDSIYNLSAGTYTLEVTDSLGCVIVFDFPLIEPANVLSSSILATTNYNGYNISCYGLNDAALQAVASGGVPGYDYYWNAVLLSDNITDLFSGYYELTIYDKNNCISTSNITLVEPDSLFIEVNSFTDTCSKGVGSSEVSVFGGVSPFVYNWSSGSTSAIINDFNEGEYQVTVSDANLCQVSDSVVINNLSNPIIDFGIYPNNQRLYDQLDDPIVFVDLTNGIWQDIVSWSWDYDDGSFGSDSISYHSYSDTGSFVVILTTVSQYNCVDTLSKVVFINDYNLYIPNTFTPFSTDDNLNNIFKAYGIGVKSFSMLIYNRWGEQIFISNSIDYGWDGTSSKNNQQVPLGTYTYFIQAENIYGELFKYNGLIRILR